MDMYASQATVADYLQQHQGWFCRCAQPMQVDPLGENGYVITIGQFGALGFEVEPKIAVILEPPQDNQYWMHTIPLPDEPFLGYEVDYNALMQLEEVNGEQLDPKACKAFKAQQLPIPEALTKVKWELKMDVAVQFPRYIYKLPMRLIRSTGDRLLTEIVRQVSPRLTFKVQKDFHERESLPLPPKSGRYFERVKATNETELTNTDGEALLNNLNYEES